MSKKGMSTDEFKHKIDPSPEHRALKVEYETLKKRLDSYKIDHGTVERFFSEVGTRQVNCLFIIAAGQDPVLAGNIPRFHKVFQ